VHQHKHLTQNLVYNIGNISIQAGQKFASWLLLGSNLNRNKIINCALFQFIFLWISTISANGEGVLVKHFTEPITVAKESLKKFIKFFISRSPITNYIALTTSSGPLMHYLKMCHLRNIAGNKSESYKNELS
jgi:hypothetical protein